MRENQLPFAPAWLDVSFRRLQSDCPAARPKLLTSMGCCLLFFSVLPAQDLAQHLVRARQVCEAIRPERNLYQGGPALIDWGRDGKDGSARCVCSSFIAALLRECYHLKKEDLVGIFGEEWPEVDDIARAVTRGTRRLTRVDDLNMAKPGDFLLFDYRSNGKIPTGHIMLMNEAPRKIHTHQTKSLPFKLAEPGRASDLSMPTLLEWQVEVIDSTGAPHGKEDSRFRAEPDGSDDTGLGTGVVRLFTTEEDALAAYTWSTSSASRLRLAKNRPVMVLRWNP